ncbi:MAG: HNH endonuclease [Thermoplasmataceae archaeon]
MERNKDKCKGDSAKSLIGYGREVIKRDDYKCRYCGEEFKTFDKWLFLTIDHVIPQAVIVEEGLKLGKENMVAACRVCNSFANRNKYKDVESSSTKERIEKTIEAKRIQIAEKKKKYKEFFDNCIRMDKEINKPENI